MPSQVKECTIIVASFIFISLAVHIENGEIRRFEENVFVSI